MKKVFATGHGLISIQKYFGAIMSCSDKKDCEVVMIKNQNA